MRPFERGGGGACLKSAGEAERIKIKQKVSNRKADSVEVSWPIELDRAVAPLYSSFFIMTCRHLLLIWSCQPPPSLSTLFIVSILWLTKVTIPFSHFRIVDSIEYIKSQLSPTQCTCSDRRHVLYHELFIQCSRFVCPSVLVRRRRSLLPTSFSAPFEHVFWFALSDLFRRSQRSQIFIFSMFHNWLVSTCRPAFRHTTNCTCRRIIWANCAWKRRWIRCRRVVRFVRWPARNFRSILVGGNEDRCFVTLISPLCRRAVSMSPFFVS